MGAVILVLRIRRRPLPADFQGDVFPHAYRLMWFVLIAQDGLAQRVTGPEKVWNEVVFKIYHVLLFIISGVTIRHVRLLQLCPSPP